MLISGREAVRILLSRGVMTGEAQARSLLRTGIAGGGTVTDTGVLFDSGAVLAVAERPWLSVSAQQAACPRGHYVARIARSVPLDLTRPWAQTAEALSLVPRMPPTASAVLCATVTALGPLPWVATFHGFVALGADLIELTTDDRGITRFDLRPPGEWFGVWRDTRVVSHRGGRPWLLCSPRAA